MIHETAVIDDGAKIGDGTKIWHFTHVRETAEIGKDCVLGQNIYIDKNVKIGNNVHIQNNVSVYECVELEDDVFCAPSMVFTNVKNPRCGFPTNNRSYKKTLIKKGATLGANCTIVCGVTVGENAFVGAGSVVTHDVPKYSLVIGVPAKVVGYVCDCGLRLKKLTPNTWRCGCGRIFDQGFFD